MIKLAVIADDITGANDTAVQFAKHHISACVRINFDQTNVSKETAEVIVFDTDSRDVASSDAYDKVQTLCRALQKSGVTHIYKKVDSTLRGNLGAEIEAITDVFQPEITVIAPAFPRNKRITVAGVHLVDGIPIERTEFAYAPKSPVKESRIIDLLKKQTPNKNIGLVTLPIIEKGAEEIEKAVKQCIDKGQSWIVFDSTKDSHLADIVAATSFSKEVLLVGSAALAECLPDFYQWEKKMQQTSYAAEGSILIIAGSVSKTTQGQIDQALKLEHMDLVKMNVQRLVMQKKIEINRCIQEAKQLLQEKKDVLIASALDDKDVRLAIEAGKQKGMSGESVSEQIAVALGEIVAALADQELAGMVLTGGDTAVHVCRALKAEAIEVVAEVELGIPLGKLVGGFCDGLQVVTKAGAFGTKQSFVQAVQTIRKLPINKS
ncbi:four-carbon acid sugar kinase family protein [Anaerosinus massiliensis]|uniref:four-carbon acid sugar kinase family protein n=1 Tax=Massilibacillus massiliensis TaxID=1806837 RepID=UPI000A5766AC|nr:four-carbon acid sugar kinase family protein [Massilibacillus massiliensis]